MITILCSGSRGDFQPYIALAQQLKKLGKEVRITASKSVEGLIRSYGIDVYPIKADIETLKVDPKLLKAAGSSDNPMKMMLTFNKMKEYGIYMVNDYYSACEGSELIIYHPGCTVGYFAAEKFGIPSVLASPFPMHKTKEYLSVIMYGKTKSNSLTKKISYSMIQGMLWMASKSSVKGFWKKNFGEIPDNFSCPFERHTDKKHPAIVSCSNFVFKRPEDWNENIHQRGYWFVEESCDYTPPKELEDFLNAGEKPVYIGFGSMTSLEQNEGLSEIAVEAIKKSGKRGIICGMGKPKDLPKNIIAINSIPHTWLFERVSAVCHHGGAGTTAAGFKAGVPNIIIPFSNDQFAWAHRAYDLGVGAKPIPRKELTSDKLAEAIKFAITDKIITNAKTLGKDIAKENGAEECAKTIVKCLER
ncbi:glycosyltransferase family 1 protein [Clostridium sp. YIM B02515]|uniref:Glycosyltransferase family 1 protein n=1 Tax=Clostridium rhizosphaerae TaxID=2803861 RepID=A0ABS1T5F1_9CLOT|nr:glycosyltransferase [Clostridium rhizosphaerae]MBL4934559.1 glycosyltransferase family 1 protein [Clostridium rhizosphaerae]